jgi:hypothetical protein
LPDAEVAGAGEEALEARDPERVEQDEIRAGVVPAARAGPQIVEVAGDADLRQKIGRPGDRKACHSLPRHWCTPPAG